MAATAKPRATNAPAVRDGSPSLLPIRNAPPWIDTTSGQREPVGGRYRSSFWRSWPPATYARSFRTFVPSGRGTPGPGWATADEAPTDRSRNESIVRMGAS